MYVINLYNLQTTYPPRQLEVFSSPHFHSFIETSNFFEVFSVDGKASPHQNNSSKTKIDHMLGHEIPHILKAAQKPQTNKLTALAKDTSTSPHHPPLQKNKKTERTEKKAK